MGITIDDKDFQQKSSKFEVQVNKEAKQATEDVGWEILRLGERIVPHDKGLLQNSGNVEPVRDGAIVGYNKVYAARLHEHPEYRFQKGRKGKWMEITIKNNLDNFLRYLGEKIKGNL